MTHPYLRSRSHSLLRPVALVMLGTAAYAAVGCGNTSDSSGGGSGGSSAGGTVTGGSGGASSVSGGSAGATGASGGTTAGGTGGASGGNASGGAAGVTGSGGSATGGAASVGTGEVATLGDSCSPSGKLACAGNYQKLTLLCGADHTWQPNQTCGSGQYCHSEPGSEAGTCKAAVAGCASLAPGDTYCDDDDVWECGPDTTTSGLTISCEGTCTKGACDPLPQCEGQPSGHRFCDGQDARACSVDSTTSTFVETCSYCGDGICYPDEADPCPEQIDINCSPECGTVHKDCGKTFLYLLDKDRWVIRLGSAWKTCASMVSQVVPQIIGPIGAAWRVTVGAPWAIADDGGDVQGISCSRRSPTLQCLIRQADDYGFVSFDVDLVGDSPARNLIIEVVDEAATCPP